MLETFIQLEAQIDNVLTQMLREANTEAERKRLRNICLDVRDKDIIVKVVRVLKVFEQATQLLSEQNYTTAGTANVTLVGLRKFLFTSSVDMNLDRDLAYLIGMCQYHQLVSQV